ncbi:MAG TPA: tRNA pseudouridine(38-40) synthase TruA [Chlamydiales bacterium]|nr:tRNA pseudouridine(38-40) synthase TruA [Chlamydiales bacterium]
MHYKLLVSYDGTKYLGWQKTKTGASIQETIQIALKRISQEEILPEAASRTDRGVHAMGQVVSFSLQKKFHPKDLKQAMNALLPPDIRVLELDSVSPCFHPALQAKDKSYHYSLCFSEVQDPLHRLYSWSFRYPLEIEAMNQASLVLLGTHDFSAFANEKKKHPFCTIHGIEFSSFANNRLQIAITANRFLYKMARTIVGTLIYIGCGKLPKDSIYKILTSKNRKLAGITAPAHGLTLYRVGYSE